MLSMFPADVPSTNAAVLAGINSANVTLSKTLGGIKYSSNGDVISASAIFGTYQITLDEAFIESTGSRTDPLADEWEAAALCVLGVDPDGRNNDQRYTAQGVSQGESCPEDDLLRFAPQFGRSWSDEFGAAIKNDISKMGIAYMLMLGYLIVMLSRWDPVHSMIGMSFVVIIIVGFSFAGCMGIGAFIGLYNNNLNNNIPFLLLGLGVDDAFVLVSEFQRASKMNPSASVEERIGLAMKSGGMSVLITSATDALAFMVGSATVLPALSWFCMFAGIGVVLCFLLQIFLFMPCLAINARRAEASRLDCCCCFKYQETAEDQPRGCCACCGCGAKAPTVQPYHRPHARGGSSLSISTMSGLTWICHTSWTSSAAVCPADLAGTAQVQLLPTVLSRPQEALELLRRHIWRVHHLQSGRWHHARRLWRAFCRRLCWSW